MAITPPQHIKGVLEDFGEVLLKEDMVNPEKLKFFTIMDEKEDLPEGRKEML